MESVFDQGMCFSKNIYEGKASLKASVSEWVSPQSRLLKPYLPGSWYSEVL